MIRLKHHVAPILEHTDAAGNGLISSDRAGDLRGGLGSRNGTVQGIQLTRHTAGDLLCHSIEDHFQPGPVFGRLPVLVVLQIDARRPYEDYPADLELHRTSHGGRVTW